jgi:hypothetical protein
MTGALLPRTGVGRLALLQARSSGRRERPPQAGTLSHSASPRPACLAPPRARIPRTSEPLSAVARTAPAKRRWAAGPRLDRRSPERPAVPPHTRYRPVPRRYHRPEPQYRQPDRRCQADLSPRAHRLHQAQRSAPRTRPPDRRHTSSSPDRSSPDRGPLRESKSSRVGLAHTPKLLECRLEYNDHSNALSLADPSRMKRCRPHDRWDTSGSGYSV